MVWNTLLLLKENGKKMNQSLFVYTRLVQQATYLVRCVANVANSFTKQWKWYNKKVKELSST